MAKCKLFKQILQVIVLVAFGVNGVVQPVDAKGFTLPAPGTRVHLSPSVNPAVLKGIKVHPDNPLRFDFVLDPGSETSAVAKSESTKLIKYFMAALTTPEQDMWVNLSPYEKDRRVPEGFGQTEMGRDLLAQDYILKQITASIIHPDDEIGKKFWKRVYEESAKKFGHTQVPVNTFNKVWIVPDKAVVYENVKAGAAYVVESNLKVMLEEDYLSKQKHQSLPGDRSAKQPCYQAGCQASDQSNVKASEGTNGSLTPSAIASNIIREIVIPELTKEINHGQNFSQLRQVYNSLILAAWYKRKIKASILAKVYVDQKKTKGLEYSETGPAAGSTILSTKQHPSPGGETREKLMAPAASDKIVDPSSPVIRDIDNQRLPGDRSAQQPCYQAGCQENKPLIVKAPEGTNYNDVESIYQQYLQAFKKGAYNLIKDEIDPVTKKEIPRKYFSGGTNLTFQDASLEFSKDNSMLAGKLNKAMMVITLSLNAIFGSMANSQEIKQDDKVIIEAVAGRITLEKERRYDIEYDEYDWKTNTYQRKKIKLATYIGTTSMGHEEFRYRSADGWISQLMLRKEKIVSIKKEEEREFFKEIRPLKDKNVIFLGQLHMGSHQIATLIDMIDNPERYFSDPKIVLEVQKRINLLHHFLHGYEEDMRTMRIAIATFKSKYKQEIHSFGLEYSEDEFRLMDELWQKKARFEAYLNRAGLEDVQQLVNTIYLLVSGPAYFLQRTDDQYKSVQMKPLEDDKSELYTWLNTRQILLETIKDVVKAVGGDFEKINLDEFLKKINNGGYKEINMQDYFKNPRIIDVANLIVVNEKDFYERINPSRDRGISKRITEITGNILVLLGSRHIPRQQKMLPENFGVFMPDGAMFVLQQGSIDITTLVRFDRIDSAMEASNSTETVSQVGPVDEAMINDQVLPISQDNARKGGIDLNSDNMQMDLRNDGQDIKFKVDEAMLNELRQAQGFTPQLLSIEPLSDLNSFLGISRTNMLPGVN